MTAGALAGATKLNVGDGTAASLSNGFAVGDTLTVNGKTLTFVAANATGTDPNEIKIDSDVTGLLAKIDGLTGSSTASTITGGKITLNTGSLSDLSLSSSNAAALSALGLAGGVTQARTTVPGVLEGKTLKIAATGGGTATDIVFGAAPGRVSSLNQLNDALAANNLQATFRVRQADDHHDERSGFGHDRCDHRFRGWRQPGVRCGYHGSGSGC